MALHPEAKAFLEQREAMGVKSATELSVEAAREQAVRVALTAGPGERGAHVEDRSVPGPHGSIPIRIHRPDDAGPLPVLVFFHDGGWVVGDLEYDPLHDEGEAYAARLRAEGVPTTLWHREGMIHGFLGPQANAEIARVLREQSLRVGDRSAT